MSEKKSTLEEAKSKMSKRSYAAEPSCDAQGPTHCYPESVSPEVTENCRLENIDKVRRMFVAKNKEDLIRLGNCQKDNFLITQKVAAEEKKKKEEEEKIKNVEEKLKKPETLGSAVNYLNPLKVPDFGDDGPSGCEHAPRCEITPKCDPAPNCDSAPECEPQPVCVKTPVCDPNPKC